MIHIILENGRPVGCADISVTPETVYVYRQATA